MDVLVYYTTKAALHLPPVNQASEGIDYIAKESTVIMMENATVVLVSITILPVSTTTSLAGMPYNNKDLQYVKMIHKHGLWCIGCKFGLII